MRKKFQSVIENIPGRKEEAEEIFDFISMAENGSSSPLCLHGNTGCGKTSMILKILEFFKSNSKTLSVAYLNCMSMWSTNHVYSGILSKLFGYKNKKSERALH